MLRSAVFGCVLVVTLASNALGQQVIGGCPVLPANNIWNTAIDSLPVLSNSTSMVNTIGASRGLHADFGAGLWDGGPIGIPFIIVPGSQAKFPATFLYWDESDSGPYAVPLNVPIEGGANATGDRHAIALDRDNCVLYELFRAFPQSSSWTADSGSIFDLQSNSLRPSTWTSADAAGLPILPGLVTFDEVQSGEIRHAIRFTAPQSRRDFVWPARHYASSLTGSQYPRMGERFRLKASFDISGFPADVQVILRAMKKYGIILADNGSGWFISGAPDSRWDDDNLRALGQVLGSNFEAVDATVLRISPDSGAAIQNGVTIDVSPASASVRIGHTQTFTATVSGAGNGVTWFVNDVGGGDSIVGTIDSTGRYVPPASVPSPSVVTVRATSVAVPTVGGSASVTIVPQPSITSVSPTSLPTGSFVLTVNGAGFVPGSTILFNGAAVTTSYVSSAKLTATGITDTAQSAIPVMVSTPDGEMSNVMYVTVTAPVPVSITISPAVTTLRVKQTRQFSASVQGTSNTARVWKVNGIVGGNGSVGTISANGLYKAPNAVPSPSSISVSATATADPAKTAVATVTVTKR